MFIKRILLLNEVEIKMFVVLEEFLLGISFRDRSVFFA